MSVYTIKDLEKFSGIKAHTIRIWESRYDLIKPKRTKTNRREYSDEDLRTIICISDLVGSGEKISKVARLSQTELNFLITNASKEETYILELKNAIQTFDEIAFKRTVNQLISKKGLEVTYLNYIIPFLYKLGVFWLNDSVSPAQEHFASNHIRATLLAHIDLLKLSDEKKQTILLFLPEKELHELNLLYLNYALKKRGHQVVYLGANVPIDSIKNCLEFYPKSSAITYSIIHNEREFEVYLKSYEALPFHKIHVINSQQKDKDKYSNVLFHKTLEILFTQI